METIDILGGKAKIGDTIYMTAAQSDKNVIEPMVVTSVEITYEPWIIEVQTNCYDYIRDGGVRRLCKTKELAEEYDSLINDVDELQKFFARVQSEVI